MISRRSVQMVLPVAVDRELVEAVMPGVKVSARDSSRLFVPRNAVDALQRWLVTQGVMSTSTEYPPEIPRPECPDWYAEQVGPVMAQYRSGEWTPGQPILFGPPWKPRSMLAVPFQIAGVARLVETGGMIFHWPTGSGKTVGAILAMLRLSATRIVWSVPNSAIAQTAARIKQFTGYDSHIWTPPSKRRKSDESLEDYKARMIQARQPRILLFIPENIHGLLDPESFQTPEGGTRPMPPRLSIEMIRFLAPAGLPGACLLVLDEIHHQASHKRFRLREDETQMDDNGDPLKWYERRDNIAAAFQYIAHQDTFTHRLGMTATVLPDRARGLYSVYDLVVPRCFGPSYWVFARRYCGARENRWGGLDDGSATHMEELNLRRASMTHRPTLEEVRLQMPPKLYTMRFVPRAAQRRLSVPKEYQRDQTALKKAGAGAGQLIYRLFLASLQVNAELIEDVQPRVARGEKVLVMAQHRAVAHAYERLIREAGIGVWSVITGETHPDADDRARTIAQWEASEGGSVLIGTGGAIGTGVDFRVASYLAMIELPFRPLDITQQSGRIGRMGTVATTEVAYYLPEGTAAERVHAILLAKLPVASAVNQDEELTDMLKALEGRDDDVSLVDAFLADAETLNFGDSDE